MDRIKLEKFSPDKIFQSIEESTGKKIFTSRVIDKNNDSGTLDALVVFEDKQIMDARIRVNMGEDRTVEVRVQGTFI